MKKNFLAILIIGSIFSATAQLKKGDITLSLNGMYTITNDYNGVQNNSLSERNSSLVSGASLTFIQNNFLFGFGLDYINESISKQSVIMFPSDFYQLEYDIVNSTIFLPNVHVGYYHSIAKNLYFTTNLKISIGAFSSKTMTALTSQGFPTDSHLPNFQPTPVNEAYTNAGLHPEFTYYFSKKFGVSLYPGGIDYSFLNWNTKGSNLIFDFNPNNWLVGVKFVL